VLAIPLEGTTAMRLKGVHAVVGLLFFADLASLHSILACGGMWSFMGSFTPAVGTLPSPE